MSCWTDSPKRYHIGTSRRKSGAQMWVNLSVTLEKTEEARPAGHDPVSYVPLGIRYPGRVGRWPNATRLAAKGGERVSGRERHTRLVRPGRDGARTSPPSPRSVNA